MSEASLRRWREGLSLFATKLVLRSRQAPIPMGLGAGLPSTKLTFLALLCATRGTPHRQCLLLGDFHGSIMLQFLCGKMVTFDLT